MRVLAWIVPVLPLVSQPSTGLVPPADPFVHELTRFTWSGGAGEWRVAHAYSAETAPGGWGCRVVVELTVVAPPGDEARGFVAPVLPIVDAGRDEAVASHIGPFVRTGDASALHVQGDRAIGLYGANVTVFVVAIAANGPWHVDVRVLVDAPAPPPALTETTGQGARFIEGAPQFPGAPTGIHRFAVSASMATAGWTHVHLEAPESVPASYRNATARFGNGATFSSSGDSAHGYNDLRKTS